MNFILEGYLKGQKATKNYLNTKILLSCFILSFLNNTLSLATDEGKEIISSDIEDHVDPVFQGEPILGERIDGPANMRDTINGKILFTLEDNVLVETAPIRNNQWFEAGLFVRLTSQQVEEEKILPGADLISGDKKVIGKALDTLNVYLIDENGDGKEGLIIAYTYIDNIKRFTIPEIALIQMLNQNRLKFSDFESFLFNFKFKEYEYDDHLVNYPFSGLREYFIYQSILEDLSARDRISLLFDNNENLVAVVHNREMKPDKFKTYELIRGHKLTIIENLEQNEIKEMVDKAIKWYNSMD
ncbi:MAG: hypothetical protein PUB21_07775 [Bacteroidales bacterium]|nr:hypothetical protein [Bacteroidales bacterium]